MTTTGFESIDRILGEIKETDVITLSSVCGMGKSALALNIAMNIWNKGENMIWFNFEIDRHAFLGRMLSIETGISFKSIARCDLTPKEWQTLVDKRIKEKWSAALDRFKVIGGSSPTVDEILFECKKYIVEHREHTDLIVIDYIEWLASCKDRLSSIADLTRKLKGMAQELKTPILILSQIDSEIEKRDNKRPQLKDLSAAGIDINSVDIALLMHRDEYYRDKYYGDVAIDDITEIEIAKNVNGDTGVIKLTFESETLRFRDTTSNLSSEKEL